MSSPYGARTLAIRTTCGSSLLRRSSPTVTAAWALGLIALEDSQALYRLVRSELIKLDCKSTIISDTKFRFGSGRLKSFFSITRSNFANVFPTVFKLDYKLAVCRFSQ